MKRKNTNGLIALLVVLMLMISMFTGVASVLAEGDEPTTPAEIVVEEPAVEEPAAEDETVVPSVDGTVVGSADSLTDEAYEALLMAAVEVEEARIAGLRGQELLDYVNTLSGDQLICTLLAMSEEQVASLEAIIGAEGVEELFSVIPYETAYISKGYTNPAAPKAAVYDPGVMSYSMRSSSGEEDPLKLSKVVNYDEETKQYVITLEAYATGSVKTTTTTTPCDIILVLDRSGSMKDSFETMLAAGYHAIADNKNSTAYNHGRTDASYPLYVKLNDDVYEKVTVTQTWIRTGVLGRGYYRYTYTWKDANGVTQTATSDRDDGSVPTALSGKLYYYLATASTGNLNKGVALESAANDFVLSVAKDAVAKDVDHRIAIVSFAANASIDSGTTQAKGAFVSLKADSNNDGIGDNYASLQNNVTNLNYSGGTYINKGMELAESIFAANAIDSANPRKRIVIVFTDGYPGSGEWSTSNNAGTSDLAIANAAIASSNTLKKDTNSNGYGATVYTIGIFKGANAGADVSGNIGNSNNTNVTSSNYAKAANRLMHYMSTDHPSAPSSLLTYQAKTNSGYYLSATNAVELQQIFANLSHEATQGGTSVTLDEESVVKDVISTYFTLPENAQTSAIKVYTQAYTAENKWADRVAFTDAEIVINGDTVTVSNFSFKDNYVGTSTAANGDVTYIGKKLVIEFPVVPKDGFLGGNSVPTNKDTSGVYVDDKAEEPTGTFPVPVANVKIPELVVTAEDRSGYLSNSLTQDQLLFGSDGTGTTEVNDTVTAGNVAISLDPSATNYGLESWQNEFVNITITKPSAVALVPENDALTDKTYTLSASIAPKTEIVEGVTGPEGEATAKTGSDTANVYILTPRVKAADETVAYGTKVTLTGKGTLVDWYHAKQSESGFPTPIGTEPNVTLGYAVNGAVATETTVTEETEVEMTAKLIDVDQTEKFDFTPYTTFFRNKDAQCLFDGCDAPGVDTTGHPGKDVDPTKPKCEFVLHLGTIDLSVKKTVTGNMANRDQKFDFTATLKDKEGKQIGEAITFKLSHNGEAKLLEKLPIGATLEIVEANAGYTTSINGTKSENATYTDTITAEDANTTITFNNHKEAEIDTGISLDSLPYILLLAVVAAGVLFFVVRRKRSED